MSERVGGSSLRLWVLMRMSRWLLTIVVLSLTFFVLVALGHFGLTPLREVAQNQDALEFLFAAFIGAIITGTSIVVTINQLVLSQELGAVGEQRDRMQDAMDFRRDVESAIDVGVSPPEPATFLYDVVTGIETRADRLRESVADERDEELQEQVTEYVDSLTGNAQSVRGSLETAQFGTFEVIWNALNFNYSWKIYRARKIRHEHADVLSEETDQALEDVIESLTFFGPAREHFKTLYFQWELIDLSRTLLYIAVPALIVMASLILYVDATTLPGQTLGVDNLVWIASAGFTVGIAPFVVFIVYVLRIATVAKRTLAMGPFILRETQRDDEFE